MPPRHLWTRRQLLATAGTGFAALTASPLLAACTADEPTPRPSSPRATPSPDPDPPVRAAAAADEQRLVARYEELVRRFPALAAPMAAVVDDHRAHLAALTVSASSASPTPEAASGTPETSTSSASSAKAVIDELVTLEQQAAESRLRQVPSVSGDLARTLASIAASEATHAALLPAVATRDLASASASAAVSSAAAQQSAGGER